MNNDQPETNSSPPNERRNWTRFSRFFLILLFSIVVFIGGGSALLYLVFSKYSGIQNIWILICGAPVLLILLVIFIASTLYTHYGKPVEQIVSAIDLIAGGNLSARVPEDNSPQFERIIKSFNKMVAELERAEQQRRNLTADIAHELRTPLHIIQGNLEGILDGVYEATPEHINNTLDETKLLARLVNDLQTLSLAETGQLLLHPTCFLLADLIADLSSSFTPQAATQGIYLDTFTEDPGFEITADYDRINQVLSNLVSNALRHTPAGGRVTVETGSILGEKSDALSLSKRSVRILVKDTGSGIASEDLLFIFDRFWRGDKSRSERTHSGLGLAIAKQLVHAHNGTIEAQSVVGKGTTFTIELPEQLQPNAKQRGSSMKSVR
jgi:two-component system OmpR family sensor kinase/two-component system sensor histidine kinase BaeS